MISKVAVLYSTLSFGDLSAVMEGQGEVAVNFS